MMAAGRRPLDGMEPSPMTNPQEVASLLVDSPLEGVEVGWLESEFRTDRLHDGEVRKDIVAVEMSAPDLNQAFAHWQILRDLVPQTRAWPILTSGLQLQEANGELRLPLATVFDRIDAMRGWPTQESPAHDELLVRQEQLRSGHPIAPRADGSGREMLEIRSEALNDRFDRGPGAAALRAATGPDGHEIVDSQDALWWLHNWTAANISHDEIVAAWSDRRPRWQDLSTPEDRLLVLLPHEHPEAAATLNFYGIAGSIELHFLFARLIRSWYENWQAEPFFFFGVSVGFHVQRPPETISEALALAIEHAFVGPSVLTSGDMSLYEYAYSLVGATRWDLSSLP